MDGGIIPDHRRRIDLAAEQTYNFDHAWINIAASNGAENAIEVRKTFTQIKKVLHLLMLFFLPLPTLVIVILKYLTAVISWCNMLHLSVVIYLKVNCPRYGKSY